MVVESEVLKAQSCAFRNLSLPMHSNVWSSSSSGLMPSADTTRPRYLVSVPMRSLFSARTLKPASLRHLNFSIFLAAIWSSMVSTAMTMWSIYVMMSLACLCWIFCWALVMDRWNVEWFFFFYHTSSAVSATKPRPSRHSWSFLHCDLERLLSIRGNGNASFMVTSFNAGSHSRSKVRMIFLYHDYPSSPWRVGRLK